MRQTWGSTPSSRSSLLLSLEEDGVLVNWVIYKQPSGEPWYFSTRVDLCPAHLDAKLKTPYFDSHPKEKKALLDQLNNMGSIAFSLQQLLVDLDSAVAQSYPEIKGMPPSCPAKTVLQGPFMGIYVKDAKEQSQASTPCAVWLGLGWS